MPMPLTLRLSFLSVSLWIMSLWQPRQTAAYRMQKNASRIRTPCFQVADQMMPNLASATVNCRPQCRPRMGALALMRRCLAMVECRAQTIAEFIAIDRVVLTRLALMFATLERAAVMPELHPHKAQDAIDFHPRTLARSQSRPLQILGSR